MTSPATSTRWQPSTEQEITDAINGELLVEDHHFDGKRQIGETGKARKETARDLASFAIDGGWLLIGVEEIDEPPGWRLSPQPLAGLGERIGDVAASVADPPLFVTTRDIPSSDDPALGYVVVDVPPSPLAPHMVDGVYYGRGDKAKHSLSDAQVQRHHQIRGSLEQQIELLLDVEVARDPAGPVMQIGGRLYAVAQPLTAPRHLARSVVRDEPSRVHALLRSGDGLLMPNLSGLGPNLEYLQYARRRANGLGHVSHAVSGEGRRLISPDDFGSEQSSALDVELREDGGVRMFVGGLTREERFVQTGEQFVLAVDSLAVAWTARLVHIAAIISEVTGYRGTWQLGVHCSALRGAASHLRANTLGTGSAPTFDASLYREVTTASLSELLERPGDVVERLIGRLTWALGTDEHFAGALAALNPPQPAET